MRVTLANELCLLEGTPHASLGHAHPHEGTLERVEAVRPRRTLREVLRCTAAPTSLGARSLCRRGDCAAPGGRPVRVHSRAGRAVLRVERGPVRYPIAVARSAPRPRRARAAPRLDERAGVVARTARETRLSTPATLVVVQRWI